MGRIKASFPKVMDTQRPAGVGSCGSSGTFGSLPLPRFAGVSFTRCLLFGANTPWKRVKLTLGLRSSPLLMAGAYHLDRARRRTGLLSALRRFQYEVYRKCTARYGD